MNSAFGEGHVTDRGWISLRHVERWGLLTYTQGRPAASNAVKCAWFPVPPSGTLPDLIVSTISAAICPAGRVPQSKSREDKRKAQQRIRINGGKWCFPPCTEMGCREGARATEKEYSLRGPGGHGFSPASADGYIPLHFTEIPLLHLSAMTYYIHNGEAVSSNMSFTENGALTPRRQGWTRQSRPLAQCWHGRGGGHGGSPSRPASALG